MAGGKEGEEHPFPVDTLVNEILVELKHGDGACRDQVGQNWVCCDDMSRCLVSFKNDMETVLTSDAIDQNIHRACRKTDKAFSTAVACVSNVDCHKKAARKNILLTFADVLAEVKTTIIEHCDDLPSEPTQTNSPRPTSTATTQGHNQRTTTTGGRLKTTQVHGETTSTPMLSKGTTGATTAASNVNGSLSGNDDVTSHPESSDTILMIGAVIGGMLLVLALIMLAILKWRKFKKEQDVSGGSVSSRKPFRLGWFHSSKTSANKGETDIYAEIDEAFMEAVYKVDQDNPIKRKSNPSTNSQVNICYEAGLEDSDAIISAAKAARFRRNKPLSTSETVTGDIPKETFSNQSVKQNNEPETAFQRMRRDFSGARKGYILSQPAFTDIEYKGNAYEDIPVSDGDYVEINEPIYAVPMGGDTGTYDKANSRGFSEPRTLPQSNYSHVHTYTNTEAHDMYNADLDSVFYEKYDTMMEY